MANKSPYKDKDGLRLAGVTTVTGQELGWNKGVLINWANKKGLEGIEVGKMVDDLALVGTLGHQLVMDTIMKKETNTSDYSENQIIRAKQCLDSYLNWAKDKVIEPIL